MTAAPSGAPLVIVPGIQGRWEWMGPAIRALERTHRVRTFSLQADPRGPYFEHWHARIDRLVEEAGGGPVPLVGVSFGGLIAATYAASRPAKVSRLVLVSTPSPRWALDARSAQYARRPILSAPLFAARAVSRLGPETVRALPHWPARVAFLAGHLARTLRWPASPGQMARWVDEWQAADLAPACRSVRVPTLVVTGEPDLDRVVPVDSSLEYLTLVPQARHVCLSRTGHIGLVLRPDEFARIVTAFVEDRPAAAADGRTDPPGFPRTALP